MQYTITYHSPLGAILLAGTQNTITGLWFHEQKYFASTLAPNAVQCQTPALMRAAVWLDSYFHGEILPMNLPLAPAGSPFRQAVWKILLQIPYGQTMTYGQIAHQLARQSRKGVSAQAVGGAVGHNPISILIPCHRVIGTNGCLTGYAGGINRKFKLLQLEQRSVSLC